MKNHITSFKINLFLLFSLALLSLTNLCIGQVSVADTKMKQFDDWSPDKTGNTDVSGLLQTAVDWCITNSKTLYLASGTYLVKSQVLAKVFPSDNGTHDGTNALVITGDPEIRPVIKLWTGSAGFQTASYAGSKAVVEIQQALANDESYLFWSGISNVDFDLGKNPGAVAVKFPAAQNSFLSNIKVYSSETVGGNNFFAGFTGIPGRNAINNNIEIDGGMYGFYISGNSLGANLNGITCRNQSVAALYLNVYRAIAVTGLEVEKCSGTAIQLGNGYNPFQGNLILTDARIDLTDNTKYALTIDYQAVVLRNVFVKGTNRLVKGTNVDLQYTSSGWTKIKSYSKTPATIDGVVAYDIIDNTKTNAGSLPNPEIELPVQDPKSYIRAHTPDTIYSFKSNGIYKPAAVPDDGLDDYAILQTALNNFQKIYLPAGTYNISKPLLLNNNNVIIGDPGKRSIIKPLFTTTPGAKTWAMSSFAGSGYNVIQDMSFNTPDLPYYGAVCWQVSSGFMFNIVQTLKSNIHEYDSHMFNFNGSAGGKFYGLAPGCKPITWGTPPPTPSLNYRQVYISGTSNPITFYGLNVERGGTDIIQNPFVEIVNSANVRVFGTKTETQGIVFKISGCNNISINNVMAQTPYNNNPTTPTIIDVHNTTNFEATHIYCPYSVGGSMIDDDDSDLAKRNDFVGVYRKGTFDISVFENYDNPNSAVFNPGFSNQVFVYPTITDGNLNVMNATKISLFNLHGELLKQWTGVSRVDVSNLSVGVYLLQTEDNDHKMTSLKVLRK